MRTIILSSILALTVVGCGDSSSNDDGGEPGERTFNATHRYEFPPVFVEAGTERDYDCQSISLDNDEPLYVSAVRQINDGSWHHSNWFFIPEDEFGEDGTWDCRFDRDRPFDMVAAATLGGVVFAQSTQTLEEKFFFPVRSGVIIPPRSKLVGALHLVNLTNEDTDTAITVELETVEPEEIDISLQPLSFLIYSINIPSGMESRWQMTCDMSNIFESLFSSEPDYGIYYVLGHYHSWGNYFSLDYVEEDGTTRKIMELDNVAGDTLGMTVDPPVFADGAPGLKVTCGYNNDTGAPLTWGNDGDKEMCMFLAYIGSPVKVVSWGAQPSEPLGMVDGFQTWEAGCDTPIGIPSVF